MSTVQATPAAVYNETVIMNTKDEQREETEMNPADRQSKRTVEDDFSSDSESGVSDSDMSQSDMSDNEDVEIKKEHFGEPISLRNVTSGEGNRSEEENEWSDEEVTKRVDSEEENEWSDEEPVQRRVRSVSFSDEAPLVRLESCDSVESENMGVSRPPSVEFDSAETSPSTTRSAPVDIPTRNAVDTAKASPKHVGSTEVSPKHVDSSDIESARKQIAEQEDTIEMLRDRIRQLEMQKTDSKPTTTPRSWAKAKPTQSQCTPEPVNRVSTTKSEEQQDEPYRRMSIDERMEKFSNTESKVMTSVERPLDVPVDVSEKKDFWKSASESSKTVQTSVPRPLEAEAATAVNVQEKKTFWRSASQTEKEVVTSVPRPLDCAVDVKQKRKSFHEAMSSEFTPVREAIKEAVEVNEKKAFWTKAAEAEKEVVTSTPRPLDCAVDLKEKRKSFHEASQSNFTPVREALKEAAEVNEKKAFWTKAAEADKEVVTSSARPLDCPVDIKEKRKSFHEASQSNFTPVRPVITDVAEVNEKKAFWNKAAETEKEVVTSSARPLDCPVDMKGKMSEYTEATRTSHVKKNSVDVHDAEVNEKKNFWIKAAETEKEVVTSSARPLDCPVDVKSKMSEYTEASKEKVEEREVSSNKGSIRMKTATECCDECTKTLYFTEKIVADNKNFHKSCFKCTHCSTVLKLGNYAGLNGKIYCKPHFKQLFASKGNYNEGFGNDKLTAKWTNKS